MIRKIFVQAIELSKLIGPQTGWPCENISQVNDLYLPNVADFTADKVFRQGIQTPIASALKASSRG
jgi:hypothetical protein